MCNTTSHTPRCEQSNPRHAWRSLTGSAAKTIKQGYSWSTGLHLQSWISAAIESRHPLTYTNMILWKWESEKEVPSPRSQPAPWDRPQRMPVPATREILGDFLDNSPAVIHPAAVILIASFSHHQHQNTSSQFFNQLVSSTGSQIHAPLLNHTSPQWVNRFVRLSTAEQVAMPSQ